MAAGKSTSIDSDLASDGPIEPRRGAVWIALLTAIVFVAVTRLPVARAQPLDSDEFGFIEQSSAHWFPMHHTLFMTLARVLGDACGDRYQGFLILDMLTSVGALASLWWMLRAIVRPGTAAAATLLMGVSPIFWGYGAMAANYTAIILVGSFLFGLAFRGRSRPEAWHPYAAAAVFAIGTGYRPDIGTLWLGVFAIILWQHRFRPALGAGLLFTAINLAWLTAMLVDVGGWSRYRTLSAEYAYQCGYLNSVWNLGFVDAPVRYAVKLAMALVWTLGPALLLVPSGIMRLRHLERGGYVAAAMVVAAIPALGSHLLVQFGSPGWCFHYVPAIVVLVAIGASKPFQTQVFPNGRAWLPVRTIADPAIPRLAALSALLTAAFLFYPTNYDRPGWRGSFDLAFCRFTRIGLNTPVLNRAPAYWRTANSRPPASLPSGRATDPGAGEG